MQNPISVLLKVGPCLYFTNILGSCQVVMAKISVFRKEMLQRNGVRVHRCLRITVTSEQGPLSLISKMAGELRRDSTVEMKRDLCNYRGVVLYSHHSVPVVVYLTTTTLFERDKREVLLLAIQCIYLRLKYCLYRTNQRNCWVPTFDP